MEKTAWVKKKNFGTKIIILKFYFSVDFWGSLCAVGLEWEIWHKEAKLISEVD